MELNPSLKKILFSNKPIEKHPLGFFLPANTKVLMLGSFPPPRKRWSMDFYYPNIQNDMWRILGLLFYHDKEYFIIPGKKAFDKAKAEVFCQTYGTGIGDTAEEIVQMNDDASDKFLEVVKPWNAEKVLSQIPECHTIVITGQKSMETFLKVIPVKEPKVGHYSEFGYIGRTFRLYRMPSSSRAYPKPLEEKAAVYGNMFREAGLLI
ncbi:MAG: uracil-DNA glycosylase family protein [Tannerellaceae bacterium]|nr:uracil-DNA glycosylase family protein [Tannerellaceae bacterium]